MKSAKMHQLIDNLRWAGLESLADAIEIASSTGDQDLLERLIKRSYAS